MTTPKDIKNYIREGNQQTFNAAITLSQIDLKELKDKDVEYIRAMILNTHHLLDRMLSTLEITTSKVGE